MFDTLIVGVDGRSGGRDAIQLARQLAAPEARVVLAGVYGSVTGPGAAAALVLEAQLEACEQALAAEHAAWPSCETEAMYSPTVGRALHELATRRDAELIVVGSCHRGIAGRVLLGDDARDALLGAPCALAIAPRGYAAQAHPIRSVTVGFDGREESRLALELARELAQRCGARLNALWIVSREDVRERFPLPADWDRGTRRLIDEAQATIERVGVDGDAVAGGTREELVRASHHCDLLVLGSRGHGPLGALLHGSVSSYLERHANAALLIVPRPRHLGQIAAVAAPSLGARA